MNPGVKSSLNMMPPVQKNHLLCKGCLILSSSTNGPLCTQVRGQRQRTSTIPFVALTPPSEPSFSSAHGLENLCLVTLLRGGHTHTPLALATLEEGPPFGTLTAPVPLLPPLGHVLEPGLQALPHRPVLQAPRCPAGCCRFPLELCVEGLPLQPGLRRRVTREAKSQKPAGKADQPQTPGSLGLGAQLTVHEGSGLTRSCTLCAHCRRAWDSIPRCT